MRRGYGILSAPGAHRLTLAILLALSINCASAEDEKTLTGDWCTISRNGPTRFRLIGPTLGGLPAEPQATSFTRPFYAPQVFAL